MNRIWSGLLTIGLRSIISLFARGLHRVGRITQGICCAFSRLGKRQRSFIALFLTALILALNLVQTSPAQAQFTWGGANTWNVLPALNPGFPFPADLPNLNGTATQTFPITVDGVPYVDIRMTIDDTRVAGGILEGFRDGEPPQGENAGSPNSGGYPVGSPRLRNLWTRINPASNVGIQEIVLTIEYFRPGTLTPFPINVSGAEIFDIDISNLANPDDWQDEVVVAGFNGATPVTPVVNAPAAVSSWTQATVGNTVVVTGVADGDNSTNAGTAIATFPTTRVDRITLTYREGPISAANPSAHAISLLGPIDFALPDLTLTKTPTAATVSRGSNTTYTLRASNIAVGVNAGSTNGPITITDTLPAGLTFVSGTGTNWLCSAVGQAVTCTYSGPDIAPGASAPDVTLTVTVGGTGLTYTNTATVTTAGDSNNTNNTANATITVLAPDLSITKTAVSPPFAQNGTGSYTLQVSNVAAGANAGPTTGAVTVTDTLPAGLTFVSGTGTNWACSAVGQAVTCTYSGAAIAPGANAPPITLTVNVGAAASYTNTATVTTPNDSNPGNDSEPETVPTVVAPVPNITLTKTAARVVDTDGSGTTTPGDVIEYTITASNAAGAGTATGVTITDPIPANTTYVAGSLVAEGTARTDAAADDQANFDGTNAIFRLGATANATNGGTLAAGASATAVFRVTLGAGSPPQVSNTATLSGTNFTNQTQTTNTPVVAAVAPNITLTKTANRVIDTDGSGTTTPGDIIEYTITASNAAGAGTATGVTITDPIPANTTYVAGSLVAEGTARTDAAADDQANFNGTDAIFRLGTGANATNGGSLAAGANATAVFRVTLQVGSPPQVSNTATLSGTNFANQTQTTNTPVAVPAPPPNVTIAKTATRVVDADGSGTTTVGDTLEYSITVSNAAGAGVATGVVVTDPIPANTTYVAGSLQIDGVARTDATADDPANSDGTNAVFRLGTGANATNGGTLAAGASSTSVFRVVLGAAANPSVTNTATVNGTNFTPQNAPTTTPVGVAAGGTPNVLLVKRLTRINTTDITGFVDAPGVEDNNPNWPTPAATYLRGAITSTARPGDELEYTIYFLSAGTGAATNVRICDVLDPNVDFLPIAFNGLPGDGGLPADQGIALALNATTLPTVPTNGLTNVSDTPDRGQFLSPGAAIPVNCNSGAANTSGVVVVDVVRSPTTLPRATAPGTPTNSYGFIRLRTRVR